NFINVNKYYLASAQSSQSSFPFPTQQGNTAGTIFIKSAWKVLQPNEINSGRFHTAKAFLYTPTTTTQPTCVGPVTVGLVGLHIVQKTANFPFYIWSTFEQVDNTPADPSNPGPTPPAGWSFFNPKNPISTTNPPTPPTCPTPLVGGNCVDWQPTSSHINDATGGPTQDYRLNPIQQSQNQPALGQANLSAQAALKKINPKSVWQYYQLVEAQWQSANS